MVSMPSSIPEFQHLRDGRRSSAFSPTAGKYLCFCCRQCSQRSRVPAGPCGGTAKSPGRDGTAQCSPHPSFKPQDGGPCKVRHFSVGDCRGLPRTTGEYGGLPGTAEDCRGLWGTTGDYESYQQHFMTPFSSNTEIHLIRLKET